MSLEEKRLKRELARRQKKKELSREKAMGIMKPPTPEDAEHRQLGASQQEVENAAIHSNSQRDYKNPKASKRFDQGNRRPGGSIPRTGTRGT